MKILNSFFETTPEQPISVDWLYSWQHLLLVLFVVGALCGLYFLKNIKCRKGINIIKISIATTIVLLEIGRIIWKFGCAFDASNGNPLTITQAFQAIGFHMCNYASFICAASLYLSVFIKQGNYYLEIFKEFSVGCGLVGAGLFFIYPEGLVGNIDFFSWWNIESIIDHTLLIFVPIYYISIGELTIRIKNLWRVAIGYLFVGCTSMSASIIANFNFSFSLDMNLIAGFSNYFPFPLHMLPLIAVVFCVPTLIYLIGEYCYRRKQNKIGTPVIKQVKTIENKKAHNLSIVYFSIGIISSIPLLFLLAFLTYHNEPSWWGLLCILPIFITVIFIKLGIDKYNQSIKVVE